MGIGVIVHGYIECPGYGGQKESKRVFHHNRRVLKRLPASDPEWPFFTNSMFSMLPLRTSQERYIPQYDYQLIHFAGSYKNMYLIDAEWLVKFERLLSQLCWFSAVAMIDFSRLRYEWSVESGKVCDQYRATPPVPPHKWSFRCCQMDEQPVSNAEAIDGVFKSDYHS